MNKLKQTTRILTIFFMVFLFQSTSSFFEAKAADAACVQSLPMVIWIMVVWWIRWQR